MMDIWKFATEVKEATETIQYFIKCCLFNLFVKFVYEGVWENYEVESDE